MDMKGPEKWVLLKCLISKKTVLSISLKGVVLTPPCPTPGRYSVGRVDRDSVILEKNEATVLIAVWGRTHTAGHRPRECTEVECGERGIMRCGKGFNRAEMGRIQKKADILTKTHSKSI